MIVLPLAVVAGFLFLNREKDTLSIASERVVKITPGGPRGGIDHGRSNRSRVKWRAGAARDRSGERGGNQARRC